MGRHLEKLADLQLPTNWSIDLEVLFNVQLLREMTLTTRSIYRAEASNESPGHDPHRLLDPHRTLGLACWRTTRSAAICAAAAPEDSGGRRELGPAVQFMVAPMVLLPVVRKVVAGRVPLDERAL